jgi:hypothetical protein
MEKLARGIAEGIIDIPKIHWIQYSYTFK